MHTSGDLLRSKLRHPLCQPSLRLEDLGRVVRQKSCVPAVDGDWGINTLMPAILIRKEDYNNLKELDVDQGHLV